MLFKNYNKLILNGNTPTLRQKRKDLLEILIAAIEAIKPYQAVKNCFQVSQLMIASENIDLSSFKNLYLVGFGKASIGMAQAVCDAVSITRGIVITNDPSARIDNNCIEIIVGGHPLPTENSIKGAEKILDLFSKCQEDDCVIVLISGGGSSLFCKPRIPLKDLQKTIELMLRSGLTIDELNIIRKHLSMVKGGQLIKHTKAVCISLIISDIINDPITSIASGPTSHDPTTFVDVKEILDRYGLWEKIPKSVYAVIEEGLKGRIPDTLKEDDPAFDAVFNYIIANNEFACQAALKKAKQLGYNGRLLSMSISGEARVVGRYLIQKALNYNSKRKTILISGGETTVTVTGNGRGGRNQELVLSCVYDIATEDIVVASFATDGVDGNSDAAGAIADGFTLFRAREKKLIPAHFLKNNNSYNFFKELNDTFQTGFTGTNVMDIQIIIL